MIGGRGVKTYLSRSELQQVRAMAMNQLANGLASANRLEESVSVKEANLSMLRRLGVPKEQVLAAQGSLAVTYQMCGRFDHASSMWQDVYSGILMVHGEEYPPTIQAASNYASSLAELKRYDEARSLLKKWMPIAQRVVGKSNELTLKMRVVYAAARYKAENATLDDLREAVTTLEEIQRTARRVFGGAHPFAVLVARDLQNAQRKITLQEELEDTGFSSLAEAKEVLNAMRAMTTGDNSGPGGA